MQEQRKRAQVKWFNQEKGFGFLLIPGQNDLFFHINDRWVTVWEPGDRGEHKRVSADKPNASEERLPNRRGGEWIMFWMGESNDGRPKAIEWDFVDQYDEAKIKSDALEADRKMSGLPSRNFAGLFDLPVKGPAKSGGGETSIWWMEYFKDATTGEIYQVRCSDGVNGGRQAYSWEDVDYLNKCYSKILGRFNAAADRRSEIRISRNERVLMAGWTHSVLLQSAEGAYDGQQSESGLEGGLVGYFRGIAVICDLELADNLPPRATQNAVVAAR